MTPAPKPANEMERLAALHATALLDTGPDEAFDDLARAAAVLCGAPIALVTLVDADRQWFKSRIGIDVAETPRDVAFCAHAILDAEVFEVPDARRDPRFADNPLVTGPPRVRFYAGAPLVTASGAAVGTLCVADHAPRALTPEQRAALAALARQVVAQIELRLKTERLRATLSDLGAAMADLRALLHGIPDAIYRIDARDVFVDLKEPTDFTPYRPRHEVVGRTVADVMPPAIAAQYASHLARLRERGEPQRFEYQLTVDGARRDREARLVASGGEAYAIVRDITDRKAVDRLKSEFVSVVSHELRTPLTSIRGALGLLEGGVVGELPAAAGELVQIARSSTDRLIRLINDILDLEKIEAGGLELRRAPVEPGRLVGEALDAVRAVADGAGVALAARVAGDGLAAHGDPDRLTQVLVNLVGNAVKFSPRGGRVEVVVTRGARGAGAVRFEVRDEGRGIAPEDRARLFGRFQQLDASDARAKGGTGLGLAISKAIVELHGGAIGVDSEPGQGSTFWFEVPATAPPLVAPRDAPASAPPRADRPRALIVEDDDDVAEGLAALVAAEGFDVERATTVRDAEQRAVAARPAVAIVDIGLPDGSGLDLIERWRDAEATGALPVVIVTARQGGRGAFSSPLLLDWLTKPLDPARLTAALHRAAPARTAPTALLVEDDAAMRGVVRAQLEALGVRCVEATDGAAAIELARRELPDLIVLDVGMPRGDGFEVVDVLRREHARTPALLVYSARDLTADDRDALRLGVTRYLTKSRATHEEFLASVRELLSSLGAPRRGG